MKCDMKGNKLTLAALALLVVVAVLTTSVQQGMPLLRVAMAQADANDEHTDDEAAEAEQEAEAIQFVEEPSEELQFIDSLIHDLDMPENALEAANGMTNILLIGIDARPKEKTGRSDTMILMTLDADHNALKLTSFQRDLYVEIPGHKSNRINAAYVFGGADLLKKTLKQNFGVEVDYYVTVNFNVLADVIDQLGGLELTVGDKYVKRVNAIIYNDNKVLGNPLKQDYLTEGGTQVMNGRQAQAYARYRYGDPEGDAGRTKRQREVIVKCMEKIKNMSLLSLGKMAMDNFDKIETDMNLADMLRLAPAAFSLLSGGELKELKIPIANSFQSDTIDGMAVYVPNRTKNQKAFADFVLEK